MAEAPEKLPDDKAAVGIQAAPPEPLPRDEVYRPLSMLAIAGFALGVGYALAVTAGGLMMFFDRNRILFAVLMGLAPVFGALGPIMARERRLSQLAASAGIGLAAMAALLGLGSLVAYSGGNPWDLPSWMWGVPLAAVLVSWMARARIQASEGTLEGAWLARWGMTLGLFFGGYYALYVAGNLVAVRSQARQAADEFLAKIRQDDLQGAFLMTLPPNQRQPGSDPRAFIEVAHNTARSVQALGSFTSLRLADFLRHIQNGGADTRIEYVSGPSEFREGGYEVNVLYQVHTPQSSFEMVVPVFGQQAGSGGRQWQVLLGRINITKQLNTTPAGRDLEQSAELAVGLASSWCRSLSSGGTDTAYLQSLPEEQRAQARRVLLFSSPAAAGLLGVSAHAAGGTPADTDKVRDSRQAFIGGNFLDAKDFWADEKFKADILARLRKALASGGATRELDLDLIGVRIPLVRAGEKGKPGTMSVGARCILFEGSQAKFLAQGDVIVEVPATGARSPNQFRVVGLSLKRGQTAPVEQGPGGGEPP